MPVDMPDVVRQYTTMVERSAPDLMDLLPPSAIDGSREPAVAITVSSGSSPRRFSSVWAFAVAVAVVVFAIGFPLWLIATSGDDLPASGPGIDDATTSSVASDALAVPPVGQSEELSITVSMPTGNILGSGFTPFNDEPEYRIAGGPWTRAGRVAPDGSVDVPGVASDVSQGDIVEMRIAGDFLLAQLTIVDLTFGVFSGNTAGGTAGPELQGHDLYVCWDNGLEPPDPEASGGCVKSEIGSGIWAATGLGLAPDWYAFVQLHDNEGDIQEVAFTPSAAVGSSDDELRIHPSAYLNFDQPEGNVNGSGWPSNATVRLTKNGIEERFALTDSSGGFDVQRAYTIRPGDVIQAEVEGWFRSSNWVELTIDVFDHVNRIASGRTDMPNGTEVFLRVYPSLNDPDQWVDYPAIVVDGRWEVDIGIEIDTDSSGVITLFRDQAVNQFHYWPDG